MSLPTSPRQVYVNGRFLTQATTGVQRYAQETLNAIDASLNSQCTISWTVLAPKGTCLDSPWKNIKVREVGRLSGHAWEQLELPRYASDGCLVTLCGAPSILHKNHFFAIHDTAIYDMPDGYSFVYRSMYKLLYALSVNSSRAIFTVSNFSKERLAELFPRAANRIVTTYCGADHLKNRSDIQQDHQESIHDLRSPYVLAVSSLAPNKNFGAILALSDSLAGSGLQVAVVGTTSSKVFSLSPLTSSTITWLGRVSDQELHHLYQNAACFIFPSFYEGFGLPPIEAMTFGCPVVASRAASIPEICGQAALYFDPRSVEDLGLQLSRVLNEPQVAETLRSAGFIQASKYTWDNVARTILRTITLKDNSLAAADASRS
jgi:glycosyltransferase involved in cell wall biosynthesis